jgi:hypothetical protein
LKAAEGTQWEEAKRQAIRVLRKRAADREPIYYSQFVRKIKAIPDLQYHGDERLDRLLDEIAIEEEKAGRGLISVLVVEKMSPNLPSDGFFELASPRHPPGTSRSEIFEVERDQVYRANASRPS